MIYLCNKQNIDARLYTTAYAPLLRMVKRKVFGERIEHGSRIFERHSMEAESFVDHLPFRERSTWNQHRFLTCEECL